MREPPLNDTELRIVRGMIDEYRVARELDERRARLLKRWHVVVAVASGLTVMLLQAVATYYAVRYH